MKTKPIFVTGGCGFVGRHLVKSLVNKGNSVYIVDNLSTGKHPDRWIDDFIPGFKKTNSHDNIYQYSKGDLTLTFVESDLVQFLLDHINKNVKHAVPDFSDVYQLASIVGGRSVIDGDPMGVAIDLSIDSTIFYWLSKNKAKFDRVMYASSSAAYPVDLQSKEKHIALKEEYIKFGHSLGQPDMTYGWSKLTGEYLSKIAAEKYGFHIACVRPFSGYGEDQDLAYPVPSIAQRVARHENPIDVWGTGEQGRDFVHIDDCVEAMQVILDKVKDGRGINIGTGKLTSFIELIELFCQIEGVPPNIRKLLDKPVGVQSRYADTTILFSQIGWKPQISIKEGMTRVLNYAKKHRA
jgi:UDP-glucose 4-epimerase